MLTRTYTSETKQCAKSVSSLVMTDMLTLKCQKSLEVDLKEKILLIRGHSSPSSVSMTQRDLTELCPLDEHELLVPHSDCCPPDGPYI